ncbi:MAG TPA: hypothetical protein VF598_00580 [Hymenobacter sp.]
MALKTALKKGFRGAGPFSFVFPGSGVTKEGPLLPVKEEVKAVVKGSQWIHARYSVVRAIKKRFLGQEALFVFCMAMLQKGLAAMLSRSRNNS